MYCIHLGVPIVQHYIFLGGFDHIYYHCNFWGSRCFVGLESIYLDTHSIGIFLIYSQIDDAVYFGVLGTS